MDEKDVKPDVPALSYQQKFDKNQWIECHDSDHSARNNSYIDMKLGNNSHVKREMMYHDKFSSSGLSISKNDLHHVHSNMLSKQYDYRENVGKLHQSAEDSSLSRDSTHSEVLTDDINYYDYSKKRVRTQSNLSDNEQQKKSFTVTNPSSYASCRTSHFQSASVETRTHVNEEQQFASVETQKWSGRNEYNKDSNGSEEVENIFCSVAPADIRCDSQDGAPWVMSSNRGDTTDISDLKREQSSDLSHSTMTPTLPLNLPLELEFDLMRRMAENNASSVKKTNKKQRLSRKELRQAGKCYSTVKGKFIPEKSFTYVICSCKYQCKEISREMREAIFDSFWNMQDWQCQSNFIISCVNVIDVKRPSVTNSRRKKTRIFKFGNYRVCQLVFLNTLRINHGRLDYALSKKSTDGIVLPDQRGKRDGCKASQQRTIEVKEFLDTIPKYSSINSSKQRLNFSPDLSKAKLYDLYKEQNHGLDIVSQPIFNKIFSEYNIDFYAMKKDSCRVCDAFNISSNSSKTSDSTDQSEQRKAEHLKEAEEAQSILRNINDKCKERTDLLVITFDMQQTALLPKLNTNDCFFKQQLWVHSLGIHKCNDDSGHMMMWAEGEGATTAAEICSSLLEFLKGQNLQPYNNIISFSEISHEENYNKILITFFMFVCNNMVLDSWEHTFLQSGHSSLPNEKDFVAIGRKAKTQHKIFNLEDYIDIIKGPRCSKKLRLHRMADKFMNMQKLASKRCMGDSVTAPNFDFCKLNWFLVHRNSDEVQFTLSDNKAVHTMQLSSVEAAGTLEKITDRPLISETKYNDLMQLLALVPPQYQDFYRNLNHN